MTLFADLDPAALGLLAQFGGKAAEPKADAAGGLAAFAGLAALSGLAMIATGLVFSLFLLRLLVRKLFRGEKDLIIEKIQHDRAALASGDDNAPIIRLTGRQGGLFQLLLSLFGVNSKAEFLLTGREVRLSYSGGPTSGVDYFHVLPMQQKPSVLVAYRGTNVVQLVLYGLFAALLLLTAVVNPCNVVMVGLLVLLFLYSYFIDRAFVVSVGGHSTISVCFQRALVGSAGVDFGQVSDMLVELRDSILAVSYRQDRPGSVMPAPVPVPAAAPAAGRTDWGGTMLPPPPPPRVPVPPPLPVPKPKPMYGAASVEELKGMLDRFGAAQPEAGYYKTIMLAVARAFKTVDPEVAAFCEETYQQHRKTLGRGVAVSDRDRQQAARVCEYLERFESSVYAQKGLDVQSLLFEIQSAGGAG